MGQVGAKHPAPAAENIHGPDRQGLCFGMGHQQFENRDKYKKNKNDKGKANVNQKRENTAQMIWQTLPPSDVAFCSRSYSRGGIVGCVVSAPAYSFCRISLTRLPSAADPKCPMMSFMACILFLYFEKSTLPAIHCSISSSDASFGK